MKHKILGWIALAFVVLYVMQNPAGAARTAKSIGGGLAAAADSLGAFLTSLTA
jgi:hypothetical protein